MTPSHDLRHVPARRPGPTLSAMTTTDTSTTPLQQGHTSGHGRGRTTWHLRLPVTPAWTVATAVVLLCIPAQAIAFAADLARAFRGGRDE